MRRAVRETAFSKGLDSRAQQLVPSALGLLRKRGFGTRSKQGDHIVWLPTKSSSVRKRALSMLASPHASSDPLMTESQNIINPLVTARSWSAVARLGHRPGAVDSQEAGVPLGVDTNSGRASGQRFRINNLLNGYSHGTAGIHGGGASAPEASAVRLRDGPLLHIRAQANSVGLIVSS